jgi:uncharacterized membrane protein YfcA
LTPDSGLINLPCPFPGSSVNANSHPRCIVSTGCLYLFVGVKPFALLPFVSLSVPFAWFGGQLEIQEITFVGLLGMALLLTAVQLFWKHQSPAVAGRVSGMNPWLLGLPAGAGIGFLSGIVGIGGGIFLAPLLYLMAWGQPRAIAASSSGFILVNSVAGLAGHLMKQGNQSPAAEWMASWPLFLVVLVGGQLGSRLASRALPEVWIQRLTGVLVLYVAVRLLLRWASLHGVL